MPKKIIGNTTATPNPRPDWAQTDETKADYIKNKPTILTEENVITLIEKHVQTVVNGALDEIDALIGGEDADEGEGG